MTHLAYASVDMTVDDYVYDDSDGQPEKIVVDKKGQLNCNEIQDKLQDQLAFNATIPKLHAEIDAQGEEIKKLNIEKNKIEEELHECCYKDATGGKSRKHRKYKKRTKKIRK